MWGASDLNLQVRTQSVNKPAEQLSVRLNVRVSECCRPHCWKPLSRQSTIFQHGARGFASGRRQQHNQTCYGRRRAEEYEDEKLYEDTYEQAVAPDEPISPPPQRSFPVFVAIPGIMLLAFTLFRIVKKIQGRGWETCDITTCDLILLGATVLSMVAPLQISQRLGIQRTGTAREGYEQRRPIL